MSNTKLPSAIVTKIAQMQGLNDDDPWNHGWNTAICRVIEAIAPALPDGWEFVPETEDSPAQLRRSIKPVAP